MPGIAGIVTRGPRETDSPDLDCMIESLRHDDQHTTGRYVNRELGIAVGWTVHKGSFADCMPLVSRGEDVVLVFIGEDYSTCGNDVSAERAPQDRHHNNAEYLLAMYEQHGEDFFARLNGWFCGVLIDLNKKQGTVFNDRYGMTRIYYARSRDEFVFSSEAKAVLKARPALRSLDPESVAEYFRLQSVTGTRTLFRGVSLLPHASAWVFENGCEPKERQYFKPEDWEGQQPLKDNELFERFVTTVNRVFPRYAHGSQPVAISLTAGLDTRLILAAVEGQETFPCYTFGGVHGDTFDMSKAKELARVEGYHHDAIRLGPAYFRNYANYAPRAVYLSDGMHDAFGAHDVYFNEIARKVAPIRLTGKFGQEVVRVVTGNPMPRFTYRRDMVAPEIRRLVDAFSPPENKSKNDLSKTVFETIPWFEYGRVAVERAMLTLRSPYTDNELVKLMFQASRQLRGEGLMQARYIREKSPKLAAIVTGMGGMATFNPFLSKLIHGLFRAWFKTEYVYLYAAPHWATRIDRKLERFKLEDLFSNIQKFERYRIWIKTELADFIHDTLVNPSAGYTDFFERKCVETMVKQHIAGTHNHLTEINKVLSLELVHSTLIRQRN